MFRPLLAIAAAGLTAAPLAAATYSATLAAPVSADRYIAHDISWRCAATLCQGTTQTSRPVVLCQSLAKRAGRIESFAVDGSALPAADLASCNASARAAPADAIATR